MRAFYFGLALIGLLALDLTWNDARMSRAITAFAENVLLR